MARYLNLFFLTIIPSVLFLPLRTEALTSQDECKDVLTNAVFNTTEYKSDTFFWMSLFSSEERTVDKDEKSSGNLSFGFEGLDFGISKSDASRLRSKFKSVLDQRAIYQNRSSVLLMSGQEKIVDAWTECMVKRGGGLSIYFTQVPGQKNLVELNIQYLHADNRKFDGGEIRLVRRAAMNPKVATIAEGEDRKPLESGYRYKPGDSRSVKFDTKSAWSSDTITFTLTDGKNTKDLSAYLAPRAVLKAESQPWPSSTLEAKWKKENNAPINKVSRYADQITGGRSFTLDNDRPADDGWFFVEGTRQIELDEHGNYSYSTGSEYIKIDTVTAGVTSKNPKDGNGCPTGYRIDPTGKIISLGIGLGASGPGEHHCTATFKATEVRFVWDPPEPDQKGKLAAQRQRASK